MSETPVKQIIVYDKAYELAKIMKEKPKLIEKALFDQGNNLIALYSDRNFSDSFQNVKQLKVEALRMAIEDVAGGIKTLRHSVIGLTYKNGKVQTYISPHGTPPGGSVVFTLAWKNMAAFQNWRNGQDEEEIPDDVLQTALYRLCVALSECI